MSQPKPSRADALFDARLRAHNPKDPPLLSTEGINNLSAVFLRDHDAREKARRHLRAALRADPANVGTIRMAIDLALEALED